MKTILDKKQSPFVARILDMWKHFRESVITYFPHLQISINCEKYLETTEEKYVVDAYNSLSIEGYNVTEELLEKVKESEFQLEDQSDALAARGYYEAFQAVKESLRKVLENFPPGQVVVQDLQEWYRKLFAPSVRAGILPASDLFGYRKHQVYIRGSRHIPPAKEYL